MLNSDSLEGRGREPLRFSLMHAFQLMTIGCIYCAVTESFGHFLGLNFLGVIVLAAMLKLIRFQSIVLGSISGASLAVAIACGCAIVCGSEEEGRLMFSLLFAPIIGYLMGMTFAAYEQAELGI